MKKIKKAIVRGAQISVIVEDPFIIKKKDVGARTWLPHAFLEVRELPPHLRKSRAPAKGVARFLGEPFWVHETNLF